MIRSLEQDDIQQVLEIYNYYVLHSPATFEEEVVSIADFRIRINRILIKFPFLVFEEEGKIIGYAYANTFRTRIAYRFSTEVSVYIHKDHYRKGVGKLLYAELLSILKTEGYHTAIGGLTLPNEASIQLHEFFGFKKVAEFQESGFKFGKWHSTGFWQLMLED
jgi:L-amino acid N-acyltransferase YncA